MLRTLAVALIGIGGVLLTPVGAFAASSGCKLAILLELPVTMNGLKPVADTKLNGHDVTLIVDSGAFFSMLSPSVAAQFQLPLRPAPFNLTVKGVGGAMESISVTSVTLTLAGITFPRKWDFIVGGNEIGSGGRGLLGQNILRVADVEYDLAHGVIRLIKPEGNCRSTRPTYWAKEGETFSVMDITSATPLEPHTMGVGFLNGSKIRVLFDTGAGPSLLSLQAAERAGIKPDSHDVRPGGTSVGVGRGFVQTWIAPFQSFKIGDEEIRNTHLRIGEVQLSIADMLIGADFFLSHRVYVASSERKLYFTYNGGPVFNLTTLPDAGGMAANQKPDTTAPSPQTLPGTQEPPEAGEAAADKEKPTPSGEPTTAEEFFRRGAAYNSRHDYAHALADLRRACELAPQEPKYFVERAQVYWQDKQADLSDADIDTALKLKPDDIDALLWRAQRRLTLSDKAGAVADLDAADQAAAPQANNRLMMGHMYQSAGQLPRAIKQYGLWIDAHDEDINLFDAYTSRCWARALSGQELDQGLSDCNKALHRVSNGPGALASRGLVYLRLGQFERAISDYSAALKRQPKNAWALYGRGLAESQLKKTAEAEADLHAATSLAPHVAEDFTKRGIVP